MVRTARSSRLQSEHRGAKILNRATVDNCLVLRPVGYLLLLIIFISPGTPGQHAPGLPRPALPQLLDTLDRYPVVLLGEDHWRREAGEFYISLVTNPEFPQHANTLVLECGNSLYQPVLDRYENGEDVPFAEISQVWRNTTKVLSWDSPIYANLIAAVRERNRALSPAQRIRVIAADSPIDWSRVHDQRDYAAAFGGNKFFASIIEREVLAKGRRAVVIMGANHVPRGGDSWGNTDVTDMLEKHKRHAYVVLLTGPSPESDPALRVTQPSVYVLRGTRLGEQPYLNRRFEDAADAFLYLGPTLGTWDPDWNAIQADSVYFSELKRRHLIEFGCPFNLASWKSHSRPCSS
jgi:hypothetical protein